MGLAARISQGLQLMKEPPQWLPHTEQEERRRTFWSAYLLDKLISCGRSRPLVILDEDCTVQLPCDEHAFQAGESQKTNTLEQLLRWNTELHHSPSPFALVIMMASIFGRCTRYVHQGRNSGETLLWDTKSEFSSINSSLLLLESYSRFGDKSAWDSPHDELHAGTVAGRHQVEHLVFAHALFHLCHCLLNHPFLLRLRLQNFASKAPSSFTTRALEAGNDHARQLVDLLHKATEAGFPVETSFYAYCATIAGGIHSLASRSGQPGADGDAPAYFQQCVGFLERLAKRWPHAANMVSCTDQGDLPGSDFSTR